MRALFNLALLCLIVAQALTPPATAKDAFAAPLDRMIKIDALRPVNDFQITTEDGAKTAFSTFYGPILVVNVWATWCQPCRDEMPALQEMGKALGEARIKVLPIAVDRDGIRKVKRFYAETEITDFPVLIATGRDVVAAFAEERIPYTAIVDAKGYMIARVNGPADWADEAFIAYVKGLAEQAE